MKPPSRHKLVFINWLCVYPVITALLTLLGPHLIGHVPLPVLTLVITGLAVPIVGYGLMPLMLRLFRPWLHPPEKPLTGQLAED